MHRLLNLILVAAIAVVGWRVYTTWTVTELQVDAGSRGRPPQGAMPPTARTPPAPRLAMTITERDLFDETRRAPTVATVEAAPVPPPDVELIGVLMVGSEPEAVIKDSTGGGKPRHVIAGDDVEGYTVSAITASEVVLTSPAGEEVPLPLKLRLSPAPSSRGKARTRAAAQQKPTAAGAQQEPAGRAAAKSRNAASVRERLRELRRKRREQANRARR